MSLARYIENRYFPEVRFLGEYSTLSYVTFNIIKNVILLIVFCVIGDNSMVHEYIKST